jgi:hypothetical protein
LGVTLYYDKAWRDKTTGNWVDAGFHFLDQVVLVRRRSATSTARGRSQPEYSSFTWNDVVFRSFQAGNLKPLDFRIYRQLKSAVAKRMFRFLDKRFYHCRRWEFDLRKFAFEHIGLSRTYDTGQIKRRLRSAFTELERVSYLEPVAENDRYWCVGRGRWKVLCLKRAGESGLTSMTTAERSLAQELEKRGLATKTSAEFVKKYADQRIREKVSIFDYFVSRDAPCISRNAAGWLRRAIEDNYAMPPEVELSLASVAKYQSVAGVATVKSKALRTPRDTGEQKAYERRMKRLDCYLSSLTPEQIQAVEAAAVAAAPAFLSQQYQRTKAGGGRAYEACRRMILERHLSESLKEHDAA